MKNGELYDYARNRNSKYSEEGWLTDEEIKIIAEEILLALNFMHSKKIVHRDLKP